jgi:hypothetical protein
LRLFLKYWEPHLENEEIEMFIEHAIVALPKEEEASVTSIIEDQASEGHVDEDTFQEPTLEDQAYIEDQVLILQEISPSSSIQEK